MIKNELKGSKGEPRYAGPFTVVRRNQGGAYVLRGQDNTEYVRPISFMKVVSLREIKDVSTTNFHAEVDHILDSKVDGDGHTLYLVKWKNTPESLNEWVSEEDFDDLTPISKFNASKRSLRVSIKKRKGEWQVHPQKQGRH
jgi:hypothetical protein